MNFLLIIGEQRKSIFVFASTALKMVLIRLKILYSKISIFNGINIAKTPYIP
jgi:hypothetical protein